MELSSVKFWNTTDYEYFQKFISFKKEDFMSVQKFIQPKSPDESREGNCLDFKRILTEFRKELSQDSNKAEIETKLIILLIYTTGLYVDNILNLTVQNLIQFKSREPQIKIVNDTVIPIYHRDFVDVVNLMESIYSRDIYIFHAYGIPKKLFHSNKETCWKNTITLFQNKGIEFQGYFQIRSIFHKTIQKIQQMFCK